MDETTDRLISIANDLIQQYKSKSCPIMILTAIDSNDLDFIQNNLKKIAISSQTTEWGKILLVYLIVDHIYENYAINENENVNIWPLIEKYLGHYYRSRKILIDTFCYIFKKYNLPVIETGKKYQNTLLINSSSRHYSNRFFEYIFNQYRNKIGQNVEYDMHELANTISKEFQNDPVKINQMSHSFGLLIRDETLFPPIFERVIYKIDQRRKDILEYDLGRWEDAFDEWYSKSDQTKTIRNKTEVSMDDEDGNILIKLQFPSNRNVDKDYNITLNISDEERVIKIPTGIIRGTLCSQKYLYYCQIHTIDPFKKIYARDSMGTTLLNISPSKYRIFDESNRIVKNITPGQYKVIIQKDVKHNFPVLSYQNISDSIDLIYTKIEKDNTYQIDGQTISMEKTISKNNLSLEFSPLGETYVTSKYDLRVIPKHPSIHLKSDVSNLHIGIKGYDGRYVLNETLDVNSGILNLNDLVNSESGIYYLNISYEKYRLASVKYVLIENLQFRVDDELLSKGSGDIPYVDFYGEEVLTYDNQMYTPYIIELHGREFTFDVKTPLIFFNPHPSTYEDDWRSPNEESFDTNELEGTIKIATGCVPEGEIVQLIIRSSLGSISIPETVSNGMCSFVISNHIQRIQNEKIPFSIEILYKNQLYPILGISTLGKYDIDICNGILAITPYSLPKSCKCSFKCITPSSNYAGTMELNKTILFDINKPSIIQINELNTITNDELIIYERKEPSIHPKKIDLYDGTMNRIEVAEHLLNGNGCIQDIKEACRILEEESEKGNKYATLRLARLNLTGTLIEHDLKKAHRYFTKYLEQKNN